MKKRSFIKSLLAILVVIVSLVLVGWVLSNNKKKNEEKTSIVAQANSSVAVRISKVKKDSLQLDYTANGNFVPSQQLGFSAENSGRVVKVLVDEGAYVRRGQTLAIINTDQLSVDLESANAAYQNALKDKQRYENAFKTGGVTQQQLDQAVLALSNAEAKLAQSRIRVSDANVKASIDGIVNKRYIEPGAVVSPGTKMFELVNISTLKLQVNVNEQQVAMLNTGDNVKIIASVIPDREFAGKIKFIAAKADEALNFPVEIEVIDNNKQQIKAGMYGTAIFNFPTQPNAVLIPRSAFIGSVNSNQVFIMKTDSTAVIQKVIAGRVLGDKVEIVSGLQEGESVITSGQINLSEGTKVSVVE